VAVRADIGVQGVDLSGRARNAHPALLLAFPLTQATGRYECIDLSLTDLVVPSQLLGVRAADLMRVEGLGDSPCRRRQAVSSLFVVDGTVATASGRTTSRASLRSWRLRATIRLDAHVGTVLAVHDAQKLTSSQRVDAPDCRGLILVRRTLATGEVADVTRLTGLQDFGLERCGRAEWKILDGGQEGIG
jgi:hypothetical protein